MMKYPRVYFEQLFVGFMIIFAFSMLQSFLPRFAQQLDPTGILVGFTVSSYFFARAFIELPAGFISDRIGRRKPIVLGMALTAVGSFISVLGSSSIYFLIIGLSIWGLGAALFFTNNTALIIDLFQPSQRGTALGTFQGLEFIGSSAGAPVGGFLIEAFNQMLGSETSGRVQTTAYISMFYVTGTIMIPSFLMALLSRGLKQVDVKPRGPSTHVPIKEALNGLRNRGLLATCIASFSRMFVMRGIAATVFSLYLNLYLGIGFGLIGTILGIRTLGMCLTTIASGHLSDRIGRKPLILTGLLIESLALYLYTLASVELMIPLAFIDGVGSGMISALLVALMSEQVIPEHRGGAVGLFRTFLDFGAVVGPVIMVIIMESLSVYASFYFGAVLLLVNFPILLTVREEKRSYTIKRGPVAPSH